MVFRRILLFAATFVCALLLSTSCSTMTVCQRSCKTKGYGPPAHARAHGNRRKQVTGAELVYSSRLGVYIVTGLPNYYYHEGRFYRLRGNEWEASLECTSGWTSVSGKSLPPGLQAKQKGKHKRAFIALGK